MEKSSMTITVTDLEVAQGTPPFPPNIYEQMSVKFKI
jgi:hypothetical protein